MVEVSPYPSSEALSLIRIGEDKTRREDLDGDNWPITWAGDGDCRYDPRLPIPWLHDDGAGTLETTLVYSDRILSDKLNTQALRFRYGNVL